MENRLVKIPLAELPKLRDLFKVNWQNHIVTYYTIANYIEWFEKCPTISNVAAVYSLNGDWSDGTVLISDNFELYINTLEESKERLSTALNLLDWSNGYRINCYENANRSAVLKIAQVQQLEIELDDQCYFFFYPFDEAIKFEIETPPGITLKPVIKNHAEKINGLWPFQYPGSISYIERLIEMNPSTGVYTDDGQLIAWCLILPSKALGILQVSENYYRQGLGTMLLKVMTKRLAQDGINSLAYVYEGNMLSKSMFLKFGFQLLGNLNYFQTFPFRK